MQVKNKTIIGLKSISLLAPIELKVKNKTIIGLKLICTSLFYYFYQVKNKTIIGLKF